MWPRSASICEASGAIEVLQRSARSRPVEGDQLAVQGKRGERGAERPAATPNVSDRPFSSVSARILLIEDDREIAEATYLKVRRVHLASLRRRLPRGVPAEQADKLARPHCQVDALKDVDLAVVGVDALQLEHHPRPLRPHLAQSDRIATDVS